jgi:MSHA type pilus biogenesis protein MshL
MKSEINPFPCPGNRLLVWWVVMIAALSGAWLLQAQPATNTPATPPPAEGELRPQKKSLRQKFAEEFDPPFTNSSTAFPRFDSWPIPPAFTGTVLVSTQGMPIVNPGLAAAARDKKLYSFRAEATELKTALATFARANRLNIVPDHDVTGLVTVDVFDLPLERMLQALLEAHDVSWTEEDGLIRVRTAQTRRYVIDYLRLTRTGKGSSAVTLSSASSGAGGGASGGGGGASGGGGGGGGGSAGGGGGGAGGAGASGSQMNLDLDNPVEFWKELQEQLEKLVTPSGRESLAINRTAGLIQVTDRPSALKRIEEFLAQMSTAVARQVDIEAKLYDVTLNRQFQFGIDWQKVVFISGGELTSIGSPFGNPSQLDLNRPSFMAPGGGFGVKPSALTVLYNDRTVKAVLSALQEQGSVNVISQPRLRTLNNQTAIMKVGTDQPFFTRQSQIISSAGGLSESSGDQVSIITIGTVLAVTPQIAADDWITLDITPAITSFVEEKQSPTGESSAPVLDIKQSSTIVRLLDGQTIVMGGLIQNSSSRSRRKIPILGDIPGLGFLFEGRFNASQKKELVIFLTPTIVR